MSLFSFINPKNMLYPRCTFLFVFLIPTVLSAQIEFSETSVASGLIFEYQESLKMGGGAASFDFDNDGDDDIYIVGGQNPDGLFENDGSGNFINISQSTKISEITSKLMTTSVVTGDIDNDGYREIFVGTMGDAKDGFNAMKPNFLLKYNPVTSTFEDIISDSQITDESFCMGGHFFDSNMDGLLDLYIMNYVENPKTIQDGGQVVGFDHDCYENKLFINQGDGSFIDLTKDHGLNHEACTLAATSSDLDWDGDPDIIVANDFGKWLVPNQLYENNGAEAPYSEISSQSSTDAKMYAMGIGIGDYDEDLDLDFYITNIGKNAFFRNDGDMTFTDVSESLELQNEFTENSLNTTGWGAIMEDFNNDSYIDLFVSNGYVYSVVDVDDEEQYDELYLGSSNYDFTRATPTCGIDFLGPSRGALFGDWDSDGNLDLITITNEFTDNEAQNSINYYQNLNAQEKWIGFKLIGTNSNRDAYGTKAVIYAQDRKIMRELRGGDSHASQNSSILHFGLGTIDIVDSVKFYWPSGIIETYDLPEINQYSEIVEGIQTNTNEASIHDLITIYPNPASEYLFINLPEGLDFPMRINIMNSMGQKVLSKTLGSKSNTLNVSQLPPGIYYLKCQSQTRAMISQFTKS